MFRLQKNSMLVTLKPSITVAEYEEKLNADGLTGGYHPVTGYQVTLADCLRERTPNLLFLRYGGIEDLCVGGEVTTPKGHSFSIKTAPRSATGPDLRRSVVGSRGRLGAFREVVLRVFPLPQSQLWGIASVDSFARGLEFVRRIVSLFIRPLFLKILRDEEAEGVARSLNVSFEAPVMVAFKLAGIKGMVEAEEQTLTEKADESAATLYWAKQPAESDVLDRTLITAETYHTLMETTSPLLGRSPKKGPTPGEAAFQKFLEESPRC